MYCIQYDEICKKHNFELEHDAHGDGVSLKYPAGLAPKYTLRLSQNHLPEEVSAMAEKQLSDLSSGIFLQNFDYIVYGKRLASKSENTVEFVENTIVSRNKQELEVVASGMEAMGLSVETGYYDPDDESSVDVPKQLVSFHYVVLKEKV